MKSKVLYILLLYIIVHLSACESLIYENQEEVGKTIEVQEVYLSINKIQASNVETINEDATYFEDRIHDLALLIFDSSTGLKLCEYFDEKIALSNTEKTFTVKLTTGQRDFYFVANMPIEDLKSINSKTEMISYMNTFRDLDTNLYKGATKSKGFPMSRVYLNQTITEGGNIYSPKPFQPITNGTKEDRVRLIRAVAKLEVVLEETAINSGIKNIYYKNAYRQFGLMPDMYPPDTSYFQSERLTKIGNSYIYYMPEAMMDKNVAWSDSNPNPINYFLIETQNGTFYMVPIITNNRIISKTNYMDFAIGKLAEKPDYNIYRNRHYYYQIKNLQTLEIHYTIEPWNIDKNTTYMGYGYNVNVSESGKIRISNTIKACSPHSIKVETVSPFIFSDSTTVKIFNDYDLNAYAEYTLKRMPKTGDSIYLKLYYNDIKMKEFSK